MTPIEAAYIAGINVYRINQEKCPHPKTPEHLMQIEHNLRYVEITRAQENLYGVLDK